ncbi:hypothetical protein HYDPIDRAFT_109166 [Hydnomerulius pinastri MD-312]|nr:hypothetical protein HYDPIDRAFT_109166 [Hydnomerulius pinastri MD-312]
MYERSLLAVFILRYHSFLLFAGLQMRETQEETSRKPIEVCLTSEARSLTRVERSLRSNKSLTAMPNSHVVLRNISTTWSTHTHNISRPSLSSHYWSGHSAKLCRRPVDDEVGSFPGHRT